MIMQMIPRSLRLLDMEGCRVKPLLVRVDLWCGNIDVKTTLGETSIDNVGSF